MDRESEMKEIKKLKATIRGILVSNRRAMSVQQLRDEWTDLGNDASKFNNLMKKNGWSGWEDVNFQRKFSDIMKFSFEYGKLMVEYVPNEGTKELTDLITKTKMSKGKAGSIKLESGGKNIPKSKNTKTTNNPIRIYPPKPKKLMNPGNEQSLTNRGGSQRQNVNLTLESKHMNSKVGTGNRRDENGNYIGRLGRNEPESLGNSNGKLISKVNKSQTSFKLDENGSKDVPSIDSILSSEDNHRSWDVIEVRSKIPTRKPKKIPSIDSIPSLDEPESTKQYKNPRQCCPFLKSSIAKNEKKVNSNKQSDWRATLEKPFFKGNDFTISEFRLINGSSISLFIRANSDDIDQSIFVSKKDIWEFTKDEEPDRCMLIRLHLKRITKITEELKEYCWNIQGKGYLYT